KGSCFVAQVAIVRIGQAPRRGRIIPSGNAHRNNAIAVAHRQRTKQNRIVKTEHRAVNTDAQRHREDRDGCEARAFCEHPNRMTNFLEKHRHLYVCWRPEVPKDRQEIERSCTGYWRFRPLRPWRKLSMKAFKLRSVAFCA